MRKIRIAVPVSGFVLAIALAAAPRIDAQNRTGRAGRFQIMEASVDQIHAAYRSGQLTARQLVQQYLDRIDAYDTHGPTINSIITINPHALEDAARLDAQ